MNILLLGLGNVNREVLKFLKQFKNINIYVYKKNIKQSYHNVKFLKNYKEMLDPDLVIEALPGKNDKDAEYAYSILKNYSDKGIDIISCNKYMIQKYGHLLCYRANSLGSKIMLSSLMCISHSVDNKDFANYTQEELYKDRGIDHIETAQHIIRDIKIKWRKLNEDT